ncbi:MAG: hypothetical protein ACFB6R_01105 [Alphaproteobacteria bacterium]
MRQVWEQLWQRPLLRATTAYVVIAWLVIQVASVLLPAFELPDETLRLVILLTIVGMPAALAATWLMGRARAVSLDDARTGFFN